MVHFFLQNAGDEDHGIKDVNNHDNDAYRCKLMDGRQISAGETFKYVENGVKMVCLCPANLADFSTNKIKVECEPVDFPEGTL